MNKQAKETKLVTFRATEKQINTLKKYSNYLEQSQTTTIIQALRRYYFDIEAEVKL